MICLLNARPHAPKVRIRVGLHISAIREIVPTDSVLFASLDHLYHIHGKFIIMERFEPRHNGLDDLSKSEHV